MLSVVIPAFNEQEMVPAAAGQIDGILSRAGIPHELIFIDDGSRDATWAEIRAESEHRDTVRGVHFSRNFRKEAAIFAGLQAADGDCVAVIDCDLQHPPEKLVEMYRLWEQGVEVVEGVKTDRGEESLAHRVAAKTFYRLISEATHIDMTRASDFKLLDRKAVNVLLSMREKRAFFRALSSWIGFRTAEVPYEVRERPQASRNGRHGCSSNMHFPTSRPSRPCRCTSSRAAARRRSWLRLSSASCRSCVWPWAVSSPA